MVLSIKDNWIHAKAEHKLYVTELVNEALKVKYGKKNYIKSIFLRDFLRKNSNVIAVGKPNELKQLIRRTEKFLKRLSIQNQSTFRDECEMVLNYSRFRQKNKNKWNAYKLCKSSKYTICPYCDQSFLFTVEEGESAYRPTLDHYYAKEQYPYLAISLHNLIPSCYFCNSSLKGSKDFYKNLHLNPLYDDEVIGFRIDTTNFENFLASRHDTDSLKRTGKLFADHSQNSKAARSIKTFVLNTRYENHLSEFAEFLQCKRNLTPEKIRAINEIFGNTTNEAELLRFDVQNYKNLILGKIYKDLYFQFPK